MIYLRYEPAPEDYPNARQMLHRSQLIGLEDREIFYIGSKSETIEETSTAKLSENPLSFTLRFFIFDQLGEAEAENNTKSFPACLSAIGSGEILDLWDSSHAELFWLCLV